LDSFSILAIANPFPGSGGSYRAKKSLMEYRRHGIRAKLLIPPIERYMRDERTLRELMMNGVDFVGFTRITSGSLLSRRLHEFMDPLAPNLALRVNLKTIPRDIDAVVSFHEEWDHIWLSYYIGLKLEKPSATVLQLPAFYALKHRVSAIRRASKLYFDLVYGAYIARKIVSGIYLELRNTLDELVYTRSFRRILDKLDLIIGISRAVCVEMGLEESSRVHCMDPGVSLDEGDLVLIENIRRKFKEKKGYIVFGGRPDRLKGVAEAILVFKAIAERLDGNYKLYITGHLGEREAYRLRRLVKNIGVEDKVVFTGFVSRDERLRIVREAKLMLYPSHVDAYPYAVAESLLLGTPIVAYNIPAIDIYFKGLGGVRVVRELDIEAMADEAIDVLTSRHVDVEPPRLRPWGEIIEEEVGLIRRVSGK